MEAKEQEFIVKAGQMQLLVEKIHFNMDRIVNLRQRSLGNSTRRSINSISKHNDVLMNNIHKLEAVMGMDYKTVLDKYQSMIKSCFKDELALKELREKQVSIDEESKLVPGATEFTEVTEDDIIDKDASINSDTESIDEQSSKEDGWPTVFEVDEFIPDTVSVETKENSSDIEPTKDATKKKSPSKKTKKVPKK